MKKGVSLLETVIALSMSAVVLLMLSTLIRTYFRLEDKAVRNAKVNNDVALVKDYINDNLVYSTDYKQLMDMGNYLSGAIVLDVLDDEVTLQAKGSIAEFGKILSNPDKWFVYENGCLMYLNPTLVSKISSYYSTHNFDDLYAYYVEGFEFYQPLVSNLGFDDLSVIFRKNDKDYRYCKVVYSIDEQESFLKFSMFKDATIGAKSINLDVIDNQNAKFNYDLFTSRYNSEDDIEQKGVYGVDYFISDITACYKYALEGQEEQEYTYNLFTLNETVKTTQPISCKFEVKTDEDTDEQYYMLQYDVEVDRYIKIDVFGLNIKEALNLDKEPDIVMDNIYFKVTFTRTNENNIFVDTTTIVYQQGTYNSIDEQLPTYRKDYQQTPTDIINIQQNREYRVRLVIAQKEN